MPEMTSPPAPPSNAPLPQQEPQASLADRLSASIAERTGQIARVVEAQKANRPAVAILAEMVESFQRHQPDMLAKQAAYSLLYAVPSILIVLIALAAIVDKNTGSGVSQAMQEYIADYTPRDIQPLLQSLVQTAIVETSENTAITAALLSLAIAIWSGAGGVGALVYAVNSVYDVRETRSFLASTAINLGLTLSGGILVVVAFFLLAFGRRLSDVLTDGSPLDDSPVVAFLWSSPLWSLIFLFWSLVLLYWIALDTPKSLRWLLPGALLATFAVALLFVLLELVLSLANPGAAFGAAGGVLILLWALFQISQFAVLGAIVNAVLGRRYDRKLRDALARDPNKRRETGRIAVEELR